MPDKILEQCVAAFNQRRYDEAVKFSEKGCEFAQGRDELFWIGMHEICTGYSLLMIGKLAYAEAKLVGAMEKLRNFGFSFHQFEITSALAGVRLGVEEIRAVRRRNKKAFDMSLLPQLHLVAVADE